MEKRIPFFHFQSVKAVAKAIDPHMKSVEALKKKALVLKEEYDEKQAKLKAELDAKASKIKEEYDACKTQIDALEAGILQATGFHVADLVKKVIEPTGKTDPKTGKPIKQTKYVPTDAVSYDEETKEFVVNIKDEEPECPTHEETAGSDFDKDAKAIAGEALTSEEAQEEEAAATVEEDNEMPWND